MAELTEDLSLTVLEACATNPRQVKLLIINTLTFLDIKFYLAGPYSAFISLLFAGSSIAKTKVTLKNSVTISIAFKRCSRKKTKKRKINKIKEKNKVYLAL